MSSKPKYDLYSQEFKHNTHQVFSQMRQNNPVWRQTGIDGETQVWFVTGYDEVVAILRNDKDFVRDPKNALPPEKLEPPNPFMELLNSHMLNKDGEDHRRLRTLVGKAFTPRVIQAQRARIQALANELLDAVEDQGQMDLVNSYAFPLPMIVIAEMLGVPAKDRERFREWSNTMLTPDLSPDGANNFIKMAQAFTGYLKALFEARRKDPQDDLITLLLQAEEAGDHLSEQELFSTVVLLIIAGHETTVGLITNSVLHLLQQPEELARLREQPAQMPAMIEELLRFDNPVERATTRFAARDVELGGQQICKGEFVIPILSAANRDPSQFPNPDQLEHTRDTKRHVGFGHGIHYCLGAPLARLEGEIALNTLFQRLPNLRLDSDLDQLLWRLSPIIHSLETLPVAWDA